METEKRTVLSPKDARHLVAEGFRVTVTARLRKNSYLHVEPVAARAFHQVERSATRCFADDTYAEAGCELVAEGSWISAPVDTLILGLRGPAARTRDLVHQHCYFGHCYKQQPGWERLCTRFLRGGGILLDLE